MSILFLFIKVAKVWETPYDAIIFMGLAQLDIIALNALHQFIKRVRRGW